VQLDGRFFLGVGTGERLNEHVTGERWPGATERRSMLKEAVDIIRALLSGDNVNHRGEYYRVENAQLFTLPMTPPEIVMAVSGPKSAALAGQIADGILAVAPDASLVEGFEAAGGAGRPRMGQLHVCWAATAEQAMKTAAQQWPNGAIRGSALTDLARPKDFESVTSALADETIAADILCGPDPSPVVEAVARFAAAGYTTVYVHQIGPDQGGFLRFFIDDVLPHFD
jgi:G6PDH family F420-dependent oxidoreductase